ncbi:MAG: hypothetical protein ABIL58_08275 [Pseudomonadota bacterium]
METDPRTGKDTNTGAIIAAVTARFRSPDIATHLAALAARLPSAASLLVVGGAIRNVIMDCVHGACPPTRDIDVFIDGLDAGFSLTAALAGETTTAADLGGIRWQPAHAAHAWDLCLLPAFVIIRQYGLPPNRQTLLANIDFNVNAVIYEPSAQRFEESGCIAAIRRCELDFNSPRWVDPLLSLYRILLIGHKTGFVLSRRLYTFLRRSADMETLLRLRRVLAAKQGKAMAEAIMADYNRIAATADYAMYRRHFQCAPAV